jgi:hypothetical protein
MRSRRRDGQRPVHRGLVVVLFLMMGIWFVGRGVGIVVDARTVARDGRLADAVVLTFHNTLYAGSIGRVYIGEPLYRDVPVLALRPHNPGANVKVRYVDGERFMAAEDGAPLNTGAMLIWLMLGSAVLGFSGWAARGLYREQRQWERLETELMKKA